MSNSPSYCAQACTGSFGHAFEKIGMVCLMDHVCAAGAGKMPGP